MIQSAYLCAILYVKHQKLPFFASSATTLILLCQRLSTKGKLVSKYCNISKTPGRGSINPPPPLPPFVPPRGCEFACTSAVNVSYILAIFLYLFIAMPSGSVYRLYGIAYKLLLPIQEPTTQALSTRIRFCFKTEFFSSLVSPIVYM